MARNINVNPASDKVAYPTAYRVYEAVIVNHSGRSYDIYPIVTDFSITESLYSPSLILSINIKDTVGLMEELQLSGQERIQLKIWKTWANLDGEIEEHYIDHVFLVSEYPGYAKFANHTQVYTIKGVSPHAFYNKFKKISRSFTGTIQDFVFNVLTQDLKYDAASIVKSSRPTASVSFIVPNLSPIDAIAWALRRAYDSSGSPWYCYETLNEGPDPERPGGKIWILPQSDLVELYEAYPADDSPYEEATIYHHKPYTPEDFEERRRRILSISSSINLSKYIAGGSGAFGSTTEYIDIATKTRTRKKFNYRDEYSQMKWANSNGKNLSTTFRVNDQDLAALADAKLNYVPINSKAFESTGNYHSTTKNGMINRAHSYIENLDTITHDVTVAGDFYLNSGNRIALKIQKALDPSAQVTGSRNTAAQSDPFDLMLSGEYIVTSVVHNFKDQHTCTVRAKRDSMPTPFTSTPSLP